MFSEIAACGACIYDLKWIVLGVLCPHFVSEVNSCFRPMDFVTCVILLLLVMPCFAGFLRLGLSDTSKYYGMELLADSLQTVETLCLIKFNGAL